MRNLHKYNTTQSFDYPLSFPFSQPLPPQDHQLLFEHFKKFKGTNDYNNAIRKFAYSMLRQLGNPTWFFTLTCCARPWKTLLRALALLVDDVHLTDEQLDSMTKEEYRRLKRLDGVTCTRLYGKRRAQFLKLLSVDHAVLGGLTSFFTKEEWQRGGDQHTHGLGWAQNAPQYRHGGDNSEVIEYIDTFSSCSTYALPRYLLEFQVHHHVAATCQKKQRRLHVCRFGFPRWPMPFTSILVGYPEELEHPDHISPERFRELNDIRLAMEAVMKEMLHTAIAYDPRGLYNPSSGKWAPYAGGPLDQRPGIIHQPTSAQEPHGFYHDYWLSFLADRLKIEVTNQSYIDAIRTGVHKPTVMLQRKHWEMYVNAYGRHMSELWAANTDLQFILEPYACVQYLCTYVVKSDKGVCELMDRLKAMLASCPEASLGKMLREMGRKHISLIQVTDCVVLKCKLFLS